MLELKNVLKNKYNIATGVQQGIVFGDNGFIKVQIEPPCANQNCREDQKKWLLRMAPSESFDRWSVSAAICERFDNPDQIVKYLSNTAEVYKAMFKQLSKDYKELYDKWEELEYAEFDKNTAEDEGWTYETGNGGWSMQGLVRTHWITTKSETEVFKFQKEIGRNYICRYKDDRKKVQFWNKFTKQWTSGTMFID